MLEGIIAIGIMLLVVVGLVRWEASAIDQDEDS